jgi:hypothetical protein
VRLALTTGKPDPTRTIAITMQDGTCPPGTVDITTPVSVALKHKRSHVSVPLTFRSAAFKSPSRQSPARCTPVVTATGQGTDASQYTTQFAVDVTDGNDL